MGSLAIARNSADILQPCFLRCLATGLFGTPPYIRVWREDKQLRMVYRYLPLAALGSD